MKTKALAACYTLATWLFESGPCSYSNCMCNGTWQRADKIERRFRCVGATEAYLDRMRAEWREFLEQESKKHDERNPDRRTYLHR